jgi:hypothetical protein
MRSSDCGPANTLMEAVHVGVTPRYSAVATGLGWWPLRSKLKISMKAAEGLQAYRSIVHGSNRMGDAGRVLAQIVFDLRFKSRCESSVVAAEIGSSGEPTLHDETTVSRIPGRSGECGVLGRVRITEGMLVAEPESERQIGFVECSIDQRHTSEVENVRGAQGKQRYG